MRQADIGLIYTIRASEGGEILAKGFVIVPILIESKEQILLDIDVQSIERPDGIRIKGEG